MLVLGAESGERARRHNGSTTTLYTHRRRTSEHARRCKVINTTLYTGSSRASEHARCCKVVNTTLQTYEQLDAAAKCVKVLLAAHTKFANTVTAAQESATDVYNAAHAAE